MAALLVLLASLSLAWKAEVVEAIDGPEWTETVIRFPSPEKSFWPANDVVWAHLLAPKDARGLPAVLMLPVMAAPNVWIETRFARRLVKDGFAVMWIEMPTQFHRRPHPSVPSGQVFLARSPKRLAANFRQSVADARRALDVLADRPEVDPRRLALFGVSLGALVGSVAYAADPRPKAAVFLLGGADFAGILRDGSLSGPTVRRIGLTEESLRAAFKGIEPLERPAPGKAAWLVNARWDRVIPRANGLALAKVFPAARQDWVLGGHYTAIVHLLWLPGKVSAYLRGALGEGGKNTIKSAGRH